MIVQAIPKLPFIQKEQTIDFYVHQLGFNLRSDYGDYLIMNLGEVELHFFAFAGLQPSQSDFMIYLRINEDIAGLYQTLQKNKTKIHPNGALENKPWRQTEFSIIDPNGTLLTFGQAIPETTPAVK